MFKIILATLIIFPLVAFFLLTSADVPANNLIANWKFEEGTGTTASDSVNQFNGSLLNGTTWATGKLGKAVSFDATDDQVKVSSSGSLNNLTDMTVSAWVYQEGSGGRIITKSDSSPKRFSLMSASPNRIGFNAGYTGGVGSWVTPAESLSLNVWHHVVVTYVHGNTASTPNIYIDGVPQVLTVFIAPSGSPVADNSNLYIGSNASGNVWDGMIDEMRVYNRVLAGSEVEAIYEGDRPPNIVVITTDDQDDTGSLSTMPKVKSLLADQGITFKNSFTDFPLCCPSRASFLTGQAAHNHGVLENSGPTGGYEKLLPTEGNTLPVWLQQAGYTTAHIGRYLNGYGKGNVAPEHVPPGWNVWKGLTGQQAFGYYEYILNENGILTTYGNSEADYQTDVLSQKADDFISSQEGSSNSLFLWLAPLAPHTAAWPNVLLWPQPAPRHDGSFANLVLPQPPNFNEADISDKPSYLQSLPPIDATKSAVVAESFRKRREALLSVDDMVERVVNTLSASGKLDNTIIIFTSDNGFFHGEHRVLLGKKLVYEESVRVPLIIRGPGISANQIRNQLVNNLDVAATVVDLAKATPGRTLDGRSLKDLFNNNSTPWRSALLFQGNDNIGQSGGNNFGPFQAARTANALYAEHTVNGATTSIEKEFYDFTNDPFQLTSLHNNLNYSGQISSLQVLLNKLKTCSGQSCWITQSKPALSIIDPDVDNNGGVGASDFFAVLGKFGSNDPVYDLDNNGGVGASDFFLVLKSFGLNWPPTNLKVSKTLEFYLRGSDADGDALQFSMSGLPSGATLTTKNPTTGRFVWIPTSAEVGSYVASFTVSDGGNTSVPVTLPITVVP